MSIIYNDSNKTTIKRKIENDNSDNSKCFIKRHLYFVMN